MPTEVQVQLIGGSLTIHEDFNLGGVQRDLSRWIEAGQNLLPVMAAQRPRMQEQARLFFNKEGFPTRWPELSPPYAAWKRKHFPGKPMMRRSDRLYNSLVSVTPDSVFAATSQGFIYGTRVPYWSLHQFGRAKMPVRPTIGLDPLLMSFMGDDVVSYIIDGGRRAKPPRLPRVFVLGRLFGRR